MKNAVQKQLSEVKQSGVASWIIRERGTQKVIVETFNPKTVAALNKEKYEAVPILDYLVSLNGGKNG